MKIHLLGAPGSGVTSLGKALAEKLGVQHFDTDDYHWFTEDVLPYRRRRNPDHRRQLLTKDFSAHESWVLSGALCGWGDVFIPQFDAVVWLWLPKETRLHRIQGREQLRFGQERIAAGGDLNLVFEKFITWAAAYDDASDNIRSRAKELDWLASLPCPVYKIQEERSLEQLVEKVVEWL